MKNSKKTSFEEYIKATKMRNEGKINETDFELVQKSFVDQNGEIIYQYICEGSENVAMLTQRKDSRLFSSIKTNFFTQYELGNHPEIERILIEIDFLAADSSRALKGKRLGECLSIIYKVAKNTLGVLDSMNSKDIKNVEDDPKISKTLEVIESNLIHTRKYHQKVAKISTQKDYLLGSIIGFIGIAITALLIQFCYDQNLKLVMNTEIEFSLLCLIYYGSIGGGIGAIMSVMNRISSGNLDLSIESDHVTTTIIGIMRPLIGSVFGTLLLMLLSSGFSILTLSADKITILLSNFITLSFIAGFFERFVPDILDKTRNKILSEEESQMGLRRDVKLEHSL